MQSRSLNKYSGWREVTDDRDDDQDGIFYLTVDLKVIVTGKDEPEHEPDRYGIYHDITNHERLAELKPERTKDDVEYQF